MMKKISSYLLLLLFSVCQFSNASQSSVDWVMGEKWFADVEKDYKEGGFSAFLEENKASYAKDFPNGLDLSIPFQMEMPLGESKAKQEGEVISDSSEVERIAEEMNRALLLVISKYPSSPILQSACKEQVISASQQRAFVLVESLQFNSDSPYDTPFAELVRNIVGEYNIWGSLVALQCMNGEISSDRKEAYELVIQFEKYRTLMEAAEGQNEELALLIPIAYEAFRLSAPQKHDSEYLLSLSNGQRTPENACEEEVAEIMKAVFEYFRDKFNNS